MFGGPQKIKPVHHGCSQSLAPLIAPLMACRVGNCRVGNRRVGSCRERNYGWENVAWEIVVVRYCRVGNCRGFIKDILKYLCLYWSGILLRHQDTSLTTLSFYCRGPPNFGFYARWVISDIKVDNVSIERSNVSRFKRGDVREGNVF